MENINFNKDDCLYASVCKYYGIDGECNAGCIRYLEMKHLLDHSRIPKAYQRPIPLFPEEQDLETFKELAEIKEHINEFIKDGRNLYLFSDNTGNGKSVWVIKILLAYFDKIWNGNGLEQRGIFVSVPQFITGIKDNITLKDDKLIEDKELFKEIELLVLDDIGATGKTEYNMEQLFNIIDYRVLSGKSTLYTSNIRPENLPVNVGKRLTSRILANAEILEIKGGDNRW